MFVYIMTNRKYGVLYTGVTNDLVRRVYEHKQKVVKGFTASYNLHRLVYFDELSDPSEAIAYEKRLKRWSRPYKFDLIAKRNPFWEDLYLIICQ